MNVKNKQSQSEFFKTSASKIHHSGESILSVRFVELLKKTLGTSDQFLGKKLVEQRIVQKKIQELLFFESTWKGLISKARHEESLIKKMFPNELKTFKKLVQEKCYPPQNITHKQVRSKYMSEKCITFYGGFIKYYAKKSRQKKFNLNLLTQSHFSELSFEIDIDMLFKDLVKICMKKAFDRSINIKHQKKHQYYNSDLDDPFLYVQRVELVYEYQRVVSLYLSFQLFEKIAQLSGNIKTADLENTIQHTNTFLKDNNNSLLDPTKKENNWYRNTFDITNQLLDIFCASGVVLKEDTINVNSQNSGGKFEQRVILWLDHRVANTTPFSHHIPQLTPPLKIDTSNSSENYIKVRQGNSSATISKMVEQSLNIAQKKKFKVNVKYLSLLDEYHNDPRDKQVSFGETPYPTTWEISSLLHEYTDLKESSGAFNCLQRHCFKRAKGTLSLHNEKQNQNVIERAFFVTEVTPVEQSVNRMKHSLHKVLAIQKSKRQLLQTSIEIAQILTNFPIYYGTKLDYRTRMYPWQHLLSKTSGELKQLLCDFNPKKITTRGLINLMLSYYRFSIDYSKEFKIFLGNENFNLSIKNTRTLMKSFFDSHNLKLAFTDSTSEYDLNPSLVSLKKQGLYFSLLHDCLERLFQKKEQHVDCLIEIDQTASGLVFLSLFLGIKTMADLANLTSNKPTDIYIFVMQNVAPYVEKNLKNHQDSGRAVSFLSTNRPVQKGALMRWAYSEGGYSRRKTWVEEFKDIYGTPCTEAEFNLLNEFSNDYDNFLDYLFPKLKEQKKRILQVIEIRANILKGRGLNIRTIDGCSLEWDFSLLEQINKTYYNPVTGSSKSYKLGFEQDNPSFKAKKRRVSKLLSSAFPNIMHSIDAAVMRLIIIKVYEKTGYRVSHLHDCVLLNPNYVDQLYEVIEEIYTDESTFHRLAEKTFFQPMAEGLPDEAISEIKTIRDEFYASADSIHVTKGFFNPRNMYSPEGSVNESDLHD